MLYPELDQYLAHLDFDSIKAERKDVLAPLLDHLQEMYQAKKAINLNFICTHNSRRSHLAQCWAQAIAYAVGMEQIRCFSGGTEATEVFPEVIHALVKAGFRSEMIGSKPQSIYAIKYGSNLHPILSFSKKFNHSFNPQSHYAAIMVCSEAEQNCPVVHGAAVRLALPYEDPKQSDGTDRQAEAYQERSREIATELLFIFSQINPS